MPIGAACTNRRRLLSSAARVAAPAKAGTHRTLSTSPLKVGRQRQIRFGSAVERQILLVGGSRRDRPPLFKKQAHLPKNYCSSVRPVRSCDWFMFAAALQLEPKPAGTDRLALPGSW